ncbi:SDR family oxidoreductase [bacterium]|nr:MAG: SDR family oxidoreductase [bacterium]
MASLSLAEKHVLVVGGSRGIGAATARACSREGACVSIVYRSNAEAAEAVVSEVGAHGCRGFAVQADASDEAEISRAVDAAASAQGPLHGLVVSAGIFEGLPLQEMTVEFWERTMAQNLRSTFLSVKHAARHMDQGSIVIYTSTAGQRGSAVYSAYASSKGAQIMFMRSMAKELAPKIRVNCVAPAWTETDMADASLTELGRDKVAADFPLGRIGLPEDVAGATLFLLSDLARFVTGTTVTVDGGMDMRG